MPTIDEFQAELEQVKAQQALQTLALRQILEGKLTGTGAAGTVVALEGGQTTIDVAPFDFG
ncbi:MAG TPA: hypothetical protein VNG04_07465 [Candidatus Acidoferrum sp.]|nr:hypothetical protein [Candidatus Acidoferrum sp.]HXJ32351.1 hypothetical protein [Gemmatimonadales bacterium]